MPAIQTAIVIAAGGLGRRMGGRKPERLLNGVTLLDHAVRWAKTHNRPTAVAVRDHSQLPMDARALDETGVEVITDSAHDLGPIAALETGFRFAEKAGQSHLLMIGCDMAFLPHDLLSRLSQAIGDAGAALPESEGHPQTMAGLWRVDTGALRTFLSSGQRSLRHFAAAQGCVRVEWTDDEAAGAFADIDDEAALAAAEQRLRQPGVG